MAESLGRVATVYVSNDGGSVYTKVGEVKDASGALARDLHDATSNDDGLWKVDVRGHKKLTLSFTCNWDGADVGQEKILAAMYSDTALNWKFRPDGDTAGNDEYLGVFNVTAADLNPPTQGVSELAVTAESSGTVTRQAIT